MDFLELITHITGGIIGASIIVMLLKKLTVGKMGNVFLGVVGGLAGGLILSKLNVDSVRESTDIINILAKTGDGVIGGAVLMIIAGLIKLLIKRLMN